MRSNRRQRLLTVIHCGTFLAAVCIVAVGRPAGTAGLVAVLFAWCAVMLLDHWNEMPSQRSWELALLGLVCASAVAMLGFSRTLVFVAGTPAYVAAGGLVARPWRTVGEDLGILATRDTDKRE